MASWAYVEFFELHVQGHVVGHHFSIFSHCRALSCSIHIPKQRADASFFSELRNGVDVYEQLGVL